MHGSHVLFVPDWSKSCISDRIILCHTAGLTLTQTLLALHNISAVLVETLQKWMLEYCFQCWAVYKFIAGACARWSCYDYSTQVIQTGNHSTTNLLTLYIFTYFFFLPLEHLNKPFTACRARYDVYLGNAFEFDFNFNDLKNNLWKFYLIIKIRI